MKYEIELTGSVCTEKFEFIDEKFGTVTLTAKHEAFDNVSKPIGPTLSEQLDSLGYSEEIMDAFRSAIDTATPLRMARLGKELYM